MNIVTLTLCPAFDVHCEADSFIAGRENNAVITRRDAGGKGVNLSRALNALGIENTAVVLLGEDDASEFVSRLAADGVSPETLVYPGEVRRNVTVHHPGEDGKPGETRLSFDGFAVDSSLPDRLAPLLEGLGAGDVLTLTGRLPRLCPDSLDALVLSLVEKGVRLVLDSNSYGPERTFALSPFLIKPNRTELARFTGKEPESAREAALSAERIGKRGAENVMVSLGPLGACLACPEGTFFCEAPPDPPVSTIGAGDSSLAGFIAALSLDLTREDCLRAAVAAGSAACLREGTLPPLRSDFDRFFSSVRTERLS